MAKTTTKEPTGEVEGWTEERELPPPPATFTHEIMRGAERGKLVDFTFARPENVASMEKLGDVRRLPEGSREEQGRAAVWRGTQGVCLTTDEEGAARADLVGLDAEDAERESRLAVARAAAAELPTLEAAAEASSRRRTELTRLLAEALPAKRAQFVAERERGLVLLGRPSEGTRESEEGGLPPAA